MNSFKRLQGWFSIDCERMRFLDHRRVSLLEAIDELGSITKAAKRLPISYKSAWETINSMSDVTGHPLVACTAGGKGGGGSQLTDCGRGLVAFYRMVERKNHLAALELERLINEGTGGDHD